MRRSALVLLAAALLPVSTSAAAPARGGILVSIDVRLTPHSVDVRHKGYASGPVSAIQYHLKGTVAGNGSEMTIDEVWTESTPTTGTRSPLHRYPLLADSTVAIEFAATGISSAGVGTLLCQGTVARAGNGPTTRTGGC